MPDGRSQELGGWNRIVLRVTNLPDRVEALKKSGLHFSNDVEVGPGGKQIQLEDPDGNSIELFEPAVLLCRISILFAAHGGGGWSLDALISKRHKLSVTGLMTRCK